MKYACPYCGADLRVEPPPQCPECKELVDDDKRAKMVARMINTAGTYSGDAGDGNYKHITQIKHDDFILPIIPDGCLPEEAELMRLYTRIQPVSCKGLPGAHNVWLVVDNQAFSIDVFPVSESPERASWFCWLMAKALRVIIGDNDKKRAKQKPLMFAVIDEDEQVILSDIFSANKRDIIKKFMNFIGIGEWSDYESEGYQAIALYTAPASVKKCRWIYNEEKRWWEGSCGQIDSDNDPADDSTQYCGRCGGKIEVVNE